MKIFNSLKSFVDTTSSYINDLNVRERVILFVTLNISLFIFLFSWVIEPTFLQIKDLQKKVKKMSSDITITENEYGLLKLEYSIDPNKEIKERIDAIEKQIEKIDIEIMQKTSELIPAQAMVDVLSDLLTQQRSLELVRMSNIQVDPIFDLEDSPDSGLENQDEHPDEPQEGDVQANANPILEATIASVAEQEAADDNLEEGEVLLYRHGVKIELLGSYWDIVRYLKKIEVMEWSFFWHMIDYEVLEYPTASVVLELHTLGYDKGWLGI